jgi:hypothetical protein
LDEVLDPHPGRPERGDQVGHHLMSLGCGVVAAHQRPAGVDGVLAADVDGGGSRRDNGDVAERRAVDESFGAQQLNLGHTATVEPIADALLPELLRTIRLTRCRSR